MCVVLQRNWEEVVGERAKRITYSWLRNKLHDNYQYVQISNVDKSDLFEVSVGFNKVQ